MGLAHRIIPSFLVKNGHLVKGKRFAADRVVGHALQAIMIQAARGVDEMLVLDVAATRRGTGPNVAMLDDLTDRLFAPLTFGGGVRSVADIRELLRAGADTVVIGEAAWGGGLLREASSIAGCQAIAVTCDVVERREDVDSLRPGVRCTREAAPARAAWAAEQGAGEIILQAVDRDGMMCGYDLELIRAVHAAVRVPVVASGGCGTYEHMLEAIEAGANAVAAGAMFLFTDQTPRGAAEFLDKRGVAVRLPVEIPR